MARLGKADLRELQYRIAPLTKIGKDGPNDLRGCSAYIGLTGPIDRSDSGRRYLIYRRMG
jgi:hypothetical protein